MAAGFEISTTSLILVCFLVFLAGFVDASAGGGGIISLPAYIFTGMPAHFALGCNKFSSSCGTTLAVFKFWRNGAVNLRAAAVAAFGSFLGSTVKGVLCTAPSRSFSQFVHFVTFLWHKKSPAPQKRCQAYLPTVIFSHPKWLLKNSRKSFSSASSPPAFSIYGANFFRSKLSFFGGIAALRSSAALASRHAA